MKIKMLQTVKVYGTDAVYYKGRVYEAVEAYNQPNYKRNGLYFVTAKDGRCEALVTKGKDIKLI